MDYPTVLPAGANTCAYTIQRQGDICQLRLDFQDVVLTTNANGLVDATAGGRLVAAGNSGNDPPAVSGTLSGDHSENTLHLNCVLKKITNHFLLLLVYVEVVGQDPTITITTLAANANQKWNVSTRSNFKRRFSSF